jgi:hypothetical protein
MKNLVPTQASAVDCLNWAEVQPCTQNFVLQGLVLSCLGFLVLAGCAAKVVQAPTPAEIAAAGPPPPPYSGPTIPKCLGIPECAAATKECAVILCTCLKRQFPALGAEAPNLGEVGPGSAPAVKCAAEIIGEEAKAPQKIDAIRYLGRVGCTKCYPCVEEGLLAALDDCTEEVRFEAAKALRQAASEPCKCCKFTSCCTQKVYEKLHKIAYETRADGCPVEPSPRVRRMARLALCRCGGPVAFEEPEAPVPTEGPSGAAPPPLPPPAKPAGEAPPAESGAAPPPPAAAAKTEGPPPTAAVAEPKATTAAANTPEPKDGATATTSTPNQSNSPPAGGTSKTPAADPQAAAALRILAPANNSPAAETTSPHVAQPLMNPFRPQLK